METKEQATNRFYRVCQEHELRITPQRTVIFEAMLDAADHPTAEIVYQSVREKMPNVSYDTVNRTLFSFAELGIIKQVQSRGSAKRFDPEIDQHHHFQCVKCNRIIDFKNESYDRLRLPNNLPKGVQVLEKKVLLEGICDECKT